MENGNYLKGFQLKDIKERAEEIVNDSKNYKYNVLDKNCEHCSTYRSTGHSFSLQILHMEAKLITLLMGNSAIRKCIFWVNLNTDLRTSQIVLFKVLRIFFPGDII